MTTLPRGVVIILVSLFIVGFLFYTTKIQKERIAEEAAYCNKTLGENNWEWIPDASHCKPFIPCAAGWKCSPIEPSRVAGAKE